MCALSAVKGMKLNMEKFKNLLVNKYFLIIFVLILVLLFLLFISFGNKKSSSFSLPMNTEKIIEKGDFTNVTYSKIIDIVGEFDLVDGDIHYKLKYTLKNESKIDWIEGSGLLNLPVTYKSGNEEKNKILKIKFDKFESDEDGNFYTFGVYHEDNVEFIKINVKNNILNYRIKHQNLEIKLKNEE